MYLPDSVVSDLASPQIQELKPVHEADPAEELVVVAQSDSGDVDDAALGRKGEDELCESVQDPERYDAFFLITLLIDGRGVVL